MLVAEIEFLTGVVVAATDRRDEVDWPPQPDRVFSALVASWGARGRRDDERRALEWLENQDAPRIAAPPKADRTAPTVFVPVNDSQTQRTGALAVLPAYRPRQARTFRSARLLQDKPVLLIWQVDPPDDILDALDAIARDTSYVGHSSSLTRCRFQRCGSPPLDRELAPARFRIAPGRFAALEDAFHRGERPGGHIANDAVPRIRYQSAFSQSWVTLVSEGVTPSIYAGPLLARTIRDALAGSYKKVVGEDAPEWLSGHDARDVPSQRPHLAVVPLPNVGWKYASGSVLGYALVLPRDAHIEPLRRAIDNLVEDRSGGIRNIEIVVRDGRASFVAHFSPTISPDQLTLQASRWNGLPVGDELRGAHRWSTALPIALDRMPSCKGGESRRQSMCESIALSCERIGLPRPVDVQVAGISYTLAAPSVFGEGVAKWKLPRSLEGRYLTHAVIEFAERVHGPVIIGAGRYVGLGLCTPMWESDR